MTQKEYTGFDSISYITDVLAEFGSKKIFLVTGRQSYFASGAKSHLDILLKDYEVHRFCEFNVNPRIEDIDRGMGVLNVSQCDTVIAVGGGSTIDVAKSVNFLAVHPLTLGGYKLSSEASASMLRPLIAIPTTSGSGSEATHFAAVYVDKQKYSVDNEHILPAVSIVDANLMMSLPKYVTAVSGLDALSQAIESYWSVHSTRHSKQFASDAIKLIVSNLPIAVKNPTAASRLKMAEAAHLAGKAINITKTTAAHSISYPLTSYFGIPHGQAVGVTLSSLIAFNADITHEDALDERGAEYVMKTINEICELLGTSSVSNASEKIDAIIHQIGLQTRLRPLGLRKKEDIEIIVANGFNAERMANNPRKVTEQALWKMLKSIC